MNFQRAVQAAVIMSLTAMSFAVPAVAQDDQDAESATGLSGMREKALNDEMDENLDQEVKKMKAQAFFEEGIRLFGEKRLADAGRQFKEAYNMLPSWKLLYNIGQCEAGVKNWGAAIEAFEKYLLLGGDEISLVRQDEVLAELDRLKQMVGKVSVDGPRGYKIYVDGDFAGDSPIVSGVMISIGMHHTVTVADAQTDEVVDTFDVSVSGGEHLRLNFNQPEASRMDDNSILVASEDVTVTTDEVTDTSTSVTQLNTDVSPEDGPHKKISPALFVVSLSTTVAALGTTLGLVLAIDSKWDAAESDYNHDPWGYDEAQDDSIRNLQIASYITGGLSILALASTIVAIPLTDWKSRNERSASGVRLFPYGHRSSAGLIVTTSF